MERILQAIKRGNLVVLRFCLGNILLCDRVMHLHIARQSCSDFTHTTHKYIRTRSSTSHHKHEHVHYRIPPPRARRLDCPIFRSRASFSRPAQDSLAALSSVPGPVLIRGEPVMAPNPPPPFHILLIYEHTAPAELDACPTSVANPNTLLVYTLSSVAVSGRLSSRACSQSKSKISSKPAART